MTWNIRFSLGAVLLATLAAATPRTALAEEPVPARSIPEGEVPKLTDDTYEKWLHYVLPDEKANAWRKIGWRTTFWEALEEAKKTNRPILLWTMNGHPCGSV